MNEFQLTDKQAEFRAATNDGGEVSISEVAPMIKLTRSELESLAADLEAKHLMARAGKPLRQEGLDWILRVISDATAADQDKREDIANFILSDQMT